MYIFLDQIHSKHQIYNAEANVSARAKQLEWIDRASVSRLSKPYRLISASQAMLVSLLHSKPAVQREKYEINKVL
jgi:hypothetical protein